MRTEKTVCCKDGKYRSCGDILGEDMEDRGAAEGDEGALSSRSNKRTIRIK